MEPIRIPRVEYVEPADGYYMRVLVPAPVGQIVESDQIVPGSQIYDSTQIIDSSQVYGSAQIIDSSQIYDSVQVIDSANIIQSIPIIDGSQLRNSDGTYIQGVTVYSGGENTHAQNNFYGTNSSGATGVIDIESASMGIGANQYAGLNYSSSSNMSNTIENMDSDYRIVTLTSVGNGYTNLRENGRDDDMKLKMDAPLEIANVDNFVMQNMPDMENLDTLNIDFDINAMDLDGEENFPGLDLGSNNLIQEAPVDSYRNDNSNMIQHQPNSASSTVPRVTIHTKRVRKPRKNIIKEESAPVNLSTIAYPPLEMLGINTSQTSQVSNNNIEYNTPIPHISPIYQEESQSPSYMSPVSPSPSTSSSYGSPLSPSSDSNSMRPRASLSIMTEAERYRHIRNQNNESSRLYRQKKKMNLKETQAEILLLEEKNTRLKEVYNAVKQKKDLAQSLMRGFVQDASKHRKQ